MGLTMQYFIGLVMGYVAHSWFRKTGFNYVLKPVVSRHKRLIFVIGIILTGLICLNVL